MYFVLRTWLGSTAPAGKGNDVEYVKSLTVALMLLSNKKTCFNPNYLKLTYTCKNKFGIIKFDIVAFHKMNVNDVNEVFTLE